MTISIVLTDNINTASRASKEISTLIKLGLVVKLIYMLPTYSNEEMRNINVSEHKRIKLRSRGLPKNIFYWAIKYIEFFFRIIIGLYKQKPNIVFCHDLLPLIPSFIFAKIFSKKIVYDTHEIQRKMLHPFQPKWFWEKIETYIINNSDITFITDHHRMDYMINNASVIKNKIYPIYNFPYLKELVESQEICIKNINPTRKKIIYTGIIMPGRYIDTIIKSIPSWNKNADFYIIGYGSSSYINDLIQLCKELKIEHRVKFSKSVNWNELVDYISDTDAAFAFYKNNCLNNYYCSPNKLYEALAAGVPVIGTSNPMIKEVLNDLDFGVYLNFDDINEKNISSCVNKLIDINFSKEMKLNVKNKILNKYSWESQESNFKIKITNIINDIK